MYCSIIFFIYFHNIRPMEKNNATISQIFGSLIRPPRAKYKISEGTRFYTDGTKTTSGKIFGLSYTYN